MLVLSLLTWSLALPGPARAARVVAVVTTQADAPVAQVLEGFRRQFAADLELQVFQLVEDDLAGAELIGRLRTAHPQLIFVLGSHALKVVAKTVTDIPIVFGLVLNDQDLPGGRNLTGVFLDFPVATQLDWLHRLLPKARNVGVVYNPAENEDRIKAAAGIASRLGLHLQARPITSPRELPAALDSLANSSDVLWGLSDRMVANPQTARNLLLFSFRNRIPYFGLSSAWVEAGALCALGRDYRDIGGQCAELAAKILAGQAPETLPPQAPRRVLYSLNGRTAEQMKIELSPALMRGAEKVY